MAVQIVANQASENLLAVTGAVTTKSIQFHDVTVNNQMVDALEYPSDPSETIAEIGITAAAMRGAQSPIMPDASVPIVMKSYL